MEYGTGLLIVLLIVFAIAFTGGYITAIIDGWRRKGD